MPGRIALPSVEQQEEDLSSVSQDDLQAAGWEQCITSPSADLGDFPDVDEESEARVYSLLLVPLKQEENHRSFREQYAEPNRYKASTGPEADNPHPEIDLLRKAMEAYHQRRPYEQQNMEGMAIDGQTSSTNGPRRRSRPSAIANTGGAEAESALSSPSSNKPGRTTTQPTKSSGSEIDINSPTSASTPQAPPNQHPSQPSQLSESEIRETVPLSPPNQFTPLPSTLQTSAWANVPAFGVSPTTTTPSAQAAPSAPVKVRTSSAPTVSMSALTLTRSSSPLVSDTTAPLAATTAIQASLHPHNSLFVPERSVEPDRVGPGHSVGGQDGQLDRSRDPRRRRWM